MSESCLNLSCPEVVRLSLMDQCTGMPIEGVANGYALSCPRNVSLEPITREGETSEFVSDCGYVVVRDRQDDQLQGWTLSFETASRSTELEALLTGKTLITSDGSNIGTYQESLLGCPSGAAQADPRFIVELFYKVSRCTDGADHVRFVIPNVQFKITEMDKEGQVSFFRYNGESSPSLASAIGDGPFNDFPADVTAFITGLPTDELTTNFDFEESVTITGACGTIEVPSDMPLGFFLTILTDGNEGTNSPEGSGIQVAQDSLGNYVVAANVDANDGVTIRAAVWRFLPDGTPDVTFGGSGLVVVTVPGTTTKDNAYGVAVDTDDDSIYVLIAADSGSLNVVTVAKLQSTGAIDVGFATAGFLSVIGAGSQPVRKGIFVESTGDIAVAYNVSFTGADMARFTSVGVPIDGITTYPYAGVGITNNNGDGLYALVLWDTGSANDLYLASTDIGTNTNSYVLVPVPLAQDTFSGMVGIDVDPVTFRIFLAGRDLNVPGNLATVQFDSGLAIDLGYGVAGFASFASGGFLGCLVDIDILSGGDMIVSGWAQVTLTRPVTARINGGGALVGTYGTGGVQIDNAIGPDTAMFVDTILEEGSGRAVHTGWYFDGSTEYWTMIARTLLPDGSLDPTFGMP